MSQTFRVYNSRIPRIKNTKFSRYYFHMNTNIQGNFQICISVPLRNLSNLYTLSFKKTGLNLKLVKVLNRLKFGH